MTQPDLVQQILDTWRRHNDILQYLLKEIPEDGLITVPANSRGRDIARQLTHIYRNRLGWVHYHETGKRPKLERFHKGPPPAKAELIKFVEESGEAVMLCLDKALKGELKTRMFGKNTVRWLGYLIAHESHHRGQIMLALKQNGMRLPEKVAVQGLWGKWIMGK